MDEITGDYTTQLPDFFFKALLDVCTGNTPEVLPRDFDMRPTLEEC